MIFLFVIVVSILYSADCEKRYDKHGCKEIHFFLGDDMEVNQYVVIYDKDQDGVPDKLDKCFDTPLRTEVDKNGCHIFEELVKKLIPEPVVPKIATLYIDFQSDAYDIIENDNNKIKEFADFLLKYSMYQARIVGHTDLTGDYTENIILSKNRAKAVSKALIALGVNASRLSTDGVGSNEPIAPNSTKNGRAQNRRIEVTLTKGIT